MSPHNERRGVARDPEAIWRATLTTAGSTFAQLAYLAALRDPATAEYKHHGMEALFGAEVAAKTLLESHRAVFRRWLDFRMAQKHRELEEYLKTLAAAPGVIAHNWLSLGFYRSWMPVDTPEHEQNHFLIELDTLLLILRNRFRPNGGDRESSLLQ